MTTNRPIVSPVLIGRARELEFLQQLLGAVTPGAGQCVLIAGEAGVGKTRLLHEIRGCALDEHFVALQGHCFEPDRSFPYASWIDLLRSYFARCTTDEIRTSLGPLESEFVKLLPELTARVQRQSATLALDAEVEKRRLFEALAHWFQMLSQSRPLFVSIEDVHWSDESSLDFFHFLARRAKADPIFLVATYRSDEVSPALAHMLAQFDRAHLAQEITLNPLTRDDVAEMVRAIFNIQRPIKSDFLDRLLPLTEGNPFFVEEVLKVLVEAGDIFYSDGRWERKSASEWHVPRSVQDAVQRRTEQLSAEARNLLLLAAVIGQRFTFALLQALTGLNEPELLSRIRELIAAQLLCEESAEEFAFRHALTREAVYSALLARERKTLHQQIAQALGRLYVNASDAHLADLSYHFYEAGVWEKALEYAQRAAEKAQALYATPEALIQFSRAIEAARHLNLTPPPNLFHARALVHEMLGDFEAGLADFENAIEAARTLQDPSAELQALLGLSNLWGYRDFAQIDSFIQRILDLARRLQNPTLLASTLTRFGNWHMNRGRPFEALHYQREAVELLRALDDRKALGLTLALLGVTNFNCGDLLQGIASHEEAVALLSDLQDRASRARARVYFLLPAMYITEVLGAISIPDLLKRAEGAIQLAHEVGWRWVEAETCSVHSACWSALGEYARAFELLESGRAIAEEIAHPPILAASHVRLGQMYLDLLSLADARGQLEHGLALAHECGSVTYIRLASAFLSRTCILQNDLARAASVLHAVLDSSSHTLSSPERMCWAAYAELALTRGDAARALQIVNDLIASAINIETYGPHSIPYLSHLRAQALMALDRNVEAEEELQVAREVAAAQGRKPFLWRMHISLGKIHRAQKRAEEAERESAAARLLIAELAHNIWDENLRENFLQRATEMMPAAPTLSARQRAKIEFGGLTAREREIAALIAQGKSNRAIADALAIAERTVERHVANILLKLDLHSRAQIAVWAVEKGLLKQPE